MRFEVLVGTHSEGEKLHVAGTETRFVNSNLELDKVFRLKFRRVEGIEGEAVAKDAPGFAFETSMLQYGNDISEIMNVEALACGVHIYHQAGMYRIVDHSTTPEKEITEEPILRIQVDGFVKEYLGIEPDEPDEPTVEE